MTHASLLRLQELKLQEEKERLEQAREKAAHGGRSRACRYTAISSGHGQVHD